MIHSYKPFELIEELPPGEVERLVGLLPEGARAELAAGPWPEPHCGVCRVLEGLTPDNQEALTLLDYHDTPWRRHHGPRHVREGKEVFARCREIYVAAGWGGAVATT